MYEYTRTVQLQCRLDTFENDIVVLKKTQINNYIILVHYNSYFTLDASFTL